jgi:hypothetical protein
MKPPEIFLDLDGVLADFDRHLTAAFQKSNGRPNFAKLDLAWWSSMPACAGAKQFYAFCQSQAETRFLSSPIMSPDCFAGKAKFVVDFTGDSFALKKLIIATDKHLIAAPHRILIDDSQSKVDKWLAAGGIAILHAGDFNATKLLLRNVLNRFVYQTTPSKPTLNPPQK